MANTLPFAKSWSIPGTGANNSATTFNTTLADPATGMYTLPVGADGSVAPIYNQAGWAALQNNPKALGSNEQWAGGLGSALNIANKGGGSTRVDYKYDPATQYWVPSGEQGIGQKSWWQSTGIPIAEAGLAATGAAYGLGAFGGAGEAAGGAASGALLSPEATAALETGAQGDLMGAAGAINAGIPGMVDAAGTAAGSAGITDLVSGIPSAGGSLLSKVLSNPALVGKLLGGLGGLAGGNASGTGGGGGVSNNLGPLQGTVGGGVGQGQTVGGQQQRLAQMLLATPQGEGVI